MMTAMKMVMTAMFGLVMFTAGDAEAARDGGPRHDRAGKMCQKLECTAAQKAQIDQIRATNKPEMQAEREAIRALKQQLVAEYQKDKLDSAKVKAIRGELETRKAAAKGRREANKAQIEALLTPAQKTKLAQLKAERGEKGERGERGHHRGGKHGKHGGKHGGPKHGRAHGV